MPARLRGHLHELLPHRVEVLCAQAAVHQREEAEEARHAQQGVLQRHALDDVVQQVLARQDLVLHLPLLAEQISVRRRRHRVAQPLVDLQLVERVRLREGLPLARRLHRLFYAGEPAGDYAASRRACAAAPPEACRCSRPAAPKINRRRSTAAATPAPRRATWKRSARSTRPIVEADTVTVSQWICSNYVGGYGEGDLVDETFVRERRHEQAREVRTAVQQNEVAHGELA